MGTGQKGKKYINFTLFLPGAQQREAVIADSYGSCSDFFLYEEGEIYIIFRIVYNIWGEINSNTT